jgi:hypothetical protein
MDIDSATCKTVGSWKKGERSVSPPKTRNDDIQDHYKAKHIDGTNESDKGTTNDRNETSHPAPDVQLNKTQRISSNQSLASDLSSTGGKQSALQPDLTSNHTEDMIETDDEESKRQGERKFAIPLGGAVTAISPT